MLLLLLLSLLFVAAAADAAVVLHGLKGPLGGLTQHWKHTHF